MKDAKFIVGNGTDFKEYRVNFGITERKYLVDHTCIWFDNKTGYAFTGSESGSVFTWKEVKSLYKIHSEKNMHQKCIYSIKWIEDMIFTGSGDFSIKISTTAMIEMFVIDAQGTVRSVDYHKGMLVYSTKYGNIFMREIDISQSKIGESEIIMNTHYSREEWGMGIQDDSLYSWGDDDQLIERDYKTHQTISVYSMTDNNPENIDMNAFKVGLLGQAAAKIMSIKKEGELEDKFESDLAINETLNHLAMSHFRGKLIIKPSNNPITTMTTLSNPKNSCECMEYSPDGNLLAVGCHDYNIYIYQWSKDNYALIKTLSQHQGGIIHLDWSNDNLYLRSNWDKNELIFWNVNDGTQLESSVAKDIVWSTHNWKLAWDSQGIFPYGTTPDFIDCCAINTVDGVIASGDDNGRVNIYNYPCYEETNKYRSLRGHIGHVGRLLFSEDGEHLFSFGGFDKTIIQWKRTNPKIK